MNIQGLGTSHVWHSQKSIMGVIKKTATIAFHIFTLGIPLGIYRLCRTLFSRKIVILTPHEQALHFVQSKLGTSYNYKDLCDFFWEEFTKDPKDLEVIDKCVKVSYVLTLVAPKHSKDYLRLIASAPSIRYEASFYLFEEFMARFNLLDKEGEFKTNWRELYANYRHLHPLLPTTQEKLKVLLETLMK